MIVERFRNGDPGPVYARFREKGRMTPEGLVYLSSWVNDELSMCFQLMESPERRLVDEWIARWTDLVDFEVHPVMTSAEASERAAARPSLP